MYVIVLVVCSAASGMVVVKSLASLASWLCDGGVCRKEHGKLQVADCISEDQRQRHCGDDWQR